MLTSVDLCERAMWLLAAHGRIEFVCAWQVETHIAMREAVQHGEVLKPLFSAVDTLIDSTIHVCVAFSHALWSSHVLTRFFFVYCLTIRLVRVFISLRALCVF